MKVLSHHKVLQDCIKADNCFDYNNFIEYLEKREHFNFRIKFIDFLLDHLLPYLENKGLYYNETKNVMEARRNKKERLILKLKSDIGEAPEFEIINNIFNQELNFSIKIYNGDDMVRIFK